MRQQGTIKKLNVEVGLSITTFTNMKRKQAITTKKLPLIRLENSFNLE